MHCSKIKNPRTGTTSWYCDEIPKGWKFAPIVASGYTKKEAMTNLKKEVKRLTK